MALVALDGTPLVRVGAANRQGAASIATLGTAATLDATNEAAIMVGQLFWLDGGSHTVDTSGSSSIGWRSGTTTFANAGSTYKVGIAAVDSTTGPPVRAVNSSDVITFDVNASFTGGSGVTSAAWNESVPTTGTKTIAHGDLIAVAFQLTARGGADSIIVQALSDLVVSMRPSITAFQGAVYSNASRLPNCTITASDGALGFIYGGYVATTGSTTQTWNNTSGTKEYGNVIQLPFPTKAYGICLANSVQGNCDFILYSDPLGSPVAEKTISVDLNQISASSSTALMDLMFPSPFSLAANTPYAVIAKPTSGTNVAMLYKSFNAASHQDCESPGTDCYAVNRNTGAFSAQNSSKDRFAIGLIIGAFEHGVWPSGHLGV